MNLWGHIIKHKNNKDVAYQVIKCFDEGHKVKLEVDVLNQGYVTTWSHTVQLKLEIAKENYGEWLQCLEPHNKCIRYSKWKSIV